MVGGKMTIIKYLLFFFNFLFWISGLVLIIIGSIVKASYGEVFSYANNKFADASVFIIIVGLFVCVVGFLGCFGAIKENYCMVATFAVSLSLIFILEIVAGALGFSYKRKVNKTATDALTKAVQRYGTNAGEKKLLDWVQVKLSCCGVNGTSDFDGGKNGTTCGKGKGVKSCHVGDECSGKLHTQGCKAGFIGFIKSKLVLIGVVAIVIASIQILGIVFACNLLKAIKGNYEVM